jgi:PAS domain S-box-containing protein
MPISIGNTVAAVLNLACKTDNRPFDGNDERVLSIMQGEMSLALENTFLHLKVQEQLQQTKDDNINLKRELEERKRSEELAQKNNAGLAEAQNLAHIGSWEWDARTGKMLFSDELYRSFGITPEAFDGTQETFLAMIHAEDRGLITKTALERETAMHEHRIVRRDGAVREVIHKMKAIFDDDNTCVRLVGIMQDVTEQNQAERERQKARELLVQAGKLASIRQLSIEVAHEILNPLSVISMELQLLQEMKTLPHDVQEEIANCMCQVKRIVGITEDFKRYFRKTTNVMAATDIHLIIDHVLSLYSSHLKMEDVKTEIHYPLNMPAVIIDRERMEQVILNLIMNAIDAMVGKNDKTLRIVVGNGHSQGSRPCLTVTISDTGTGIRQKDMPKLFSPFFTTKANGQGSGMGLFVSQGILKNHNGIIRAESNEWGGASFIIELPLPAPIRMPTNKSHGQGAIDYGTDFGC